MNLGRLVALFVLAMLGISNARSSDWVAFDGSGLDYRFIPGVHAGTGWTGSRFTAQMSNDVAGAWWSFLPYQWREDPSIPVTVTVEVTFRRITSDSDLGIGLTDGSKHLSTQNEDNNGGRVAILTGTFNSNQLPAPTTLNRETVGGYPAVNAVGTLRTRFTIRNGEVEAAGQIAGGSWVTAPPVPMSTSQLQFFFFGEGQGESYEFLRIRITLDPILHTIHDEFWDAKSSVAEAQPLYQRASHKRFLGIVGELSPGDVADIYRVLWPVSASPGQWQRIWVTIESDLPESIGIVMLNSDGTFAGDIEYVDSLGENGTSLSFNYDLVRSNDFIIAIFRRDAHAVDMNGHIIPPDTGPWQDYYRVSHFESDLPHPVPIRYSMRFNNALPAALDGPWHDEAPMFTDLNFAGTTGAHVHEIEASGLDDHGEYIDYTSEFSIIRTHGNVNTEWNPVSDQYIGLFEGGFGTSAPVANAGGDTSGGLILSIFYDEVIGLAWDGMDFSANIEQLPAGGAINVSIDRQDYSHLSFVGTFYHPFTGQTVLCLAYVEPDAFVGFSATISAPTPFAIRSADDLFKNYDFNIEIYGSYVPQPLYDTNARLYVTAVPDGEVVISGEYFSRYQHQRARLDIAWVPLRVRDPTCPLDFNRDEVLDLADINAFALGFVAGEPLADLNADGLFDLQDLILFVSGFVAGCGL